jgi:hypothetical protein
MIAVEEKDRRPSAYSVLTPYPRFRKNPGVPIPRPSFPYHGNGVRRSRSELTGVGVGESRTVMDEERCKAKLKAIRENGKRKEGDPLAQRQCPSESERAHLPGAASQNRRQRRR